MGSIGGPFQVIFSDYHINRRWYISTTPNTTTKILYAVETNAVVVTLSCLAKQNQ